MTVTTALRPKSSIRCLYQPGFEKGGHKRTCIYISLSHMHYTYACSNNACTLIHMTVASSPGSLGGNGICVGGKFCRRQARAWSPLFLLSQLSSDFTGTRILFVILRVVDVVRMAEQK